jgi:hypothetical protein
MRTAVTRYVTPALLALGAILSIANWYLTPERSSAWAITLAFLVFLVVPLRIARRVQSRGLSSDWISGGVGLAALMLVIGLSGKLAQAVGAIDNQDLSQRLTSALVGVFLAAIGNATPKMLTPLSAMACDGARTQAFQRFSGWTWFMAGLTYAMVWLVLPIEIAKPLSVMVVLGAVLLVATQLFRLWRTRRTA